MINDELNMPDHYIGTTNGILAQWLYNERKKMRKDTYAWNFLRCLFSMEKTDDKEYKKFYDELFFKEFPSEESCAEWISNKILPEIKTTDWGITCYINDNKWKYSSIRPSKFRDYHNHRNVFVPSLIMEDSEGLIAVFATSAAFDTYDSYEDLKKIENFTGLVKAGEAVTGTALYKQILEGYEKSGKQIKERKTGDSDGKRCKYTFDIPLINSINRKRFAELKKIKNSNTFTLPKTYADREELAYPQPTVIAAISGKDYKELFRILGTRKGDGKHTIAPEDSPFPISQICSGKVLLSAQTVLKNIKDSSIYWIELTGWSRYSVPFLPDGHYKKRWQCQFHFVNPDRMLEGYPEWTVERMEKLKHRDLWLYHLAHGDSNLEFYSDKKGKTLDWWLETYKRIDEDSYQLTWKISAENWNTTKLRIK